MSSIQVEVAGDYSALLKEIARLENVDTEEAMAAIGLYGGLIHPQPLMVRSGKPP